MNQLNGMKKIVQEAEFKRAYRGKEETESEQINQMSRKERNETRTLNLAKRLYRMFTVNEFHNCFILSI